MFRAALCALLLAVVPAVFAADTPSVRQFFDHRQFVDMQLSPDGKHVAFTYEEGSEVKLAVMDLEDKKITASFGLGEQMHVLDFYWGNNERVLMAFGKVTGNLDNLGRPAHLYAANVDGSKRQQIFEMQNSGYRLLSLLKDDPEHILIAKYHWADQGKPTVNKLNIYTGELTYQPIGLTLDNRYDVIADNKGDIRVVIEQLEGATIDDYRNNLYVRDGGDWRKLELPSKRSRADIQPLGFSADNRRAYFLSDHDMAENGRQGVFEYNFVTDEVTLLYRHDEVDVAGGIYGHDGDVLGVSFAYGYPEKHFFDPSRPESRFIASLDAAFPEQTVSVTSFTDNGKKAIAFVRGDRNPGEFYLFDVKAMKAKFLAAALPELKRDQLVEMLPVTITARDGLKLHAMLTRPRDAKGPVPLIVNVHGGPFGVTDFWGFNPEAQFFAAHGYATLQVNYRGSGNRGQDFMNLGRRGWGKVMQDDVTDATRWAVKVGVTDADHICIYGGSYGGYAAAEAIIKEPDLYQCSVAYVGVYDMPWFRSGDGSDSDHGGRDQKRGMEKWMSAYIGDDMDELRSVSPVHNVDRIKVPVFIVASENDVRVPVGHSNRFRKALDKAGKPYEWLIKPEGHGYYDVDNRVELYTKMLAFFDRYIGSGAGTTASAAAN